MVTPYARRCHRACTMRAAHWPQVDVDGRERTLLHAGDSTNGLCLPEQRACHLRVAMSCPARRPAGPRKTRRSSLGHGALCSASALPTPSTAVTASAAQVLADGFVQQPPRRAGVSGPPDTCANVASQTTYLAAQACRAGRLGDWCSPSSLTPQPLAPRSTPATSVNGLDVP